jgi:hypothetical protein
MRGIFWGFCRNRFLTSPLHYLSTRFDFRFEFAEIFVIKKRLSHSARRGVDDSPIRRVGESSTHRLGEWIITIDLFKGLKKKLYL